MRGCRYTAPPLTSTVSVVNRISLNYIIAKKIGEGIFFMTPLVPFAERRIINMTEPQSSEIEKEAANMTMGDLMRSVMGEDRTNIILNKTLD